tara:strand:+ start:359 stop:541 length:183 start_codon:yes stop_codon:yes gene_type:complete
MKEFVFKDTSKTTYCIEAENIEQAEKMFDNLWLHKHRSAMKQAKKLGVKLRLKQNVWIEY